MKRISLVALCSVILAAAAFPAFADTAAPEGGPYYNLSPYAPSQGWTQSGGPVKQSPWTVKIGAFFPADRAVKDYAGDTWGVLSGEYALNPSSSSNLKTSIFMDVAGGSNDYGVSWGWNVGNETDAVDSFAMGISLSTLTSRDKGDIAPYLSVSGGFSIDSVGSTVTFGDENSDSTTTVASGVFKAGGGVIIHNRYILEADYSDYGVIEDARLNGWGVSIGYHF